MGAVTGKGLSGLIRENFGVRWTAILGLAFISSNVFTTAAEFAGVAAAAEIFHVSRYIAVPIAGLLVFFLILRANRKVTERIFLVSSALYFSYVISGLKSQPHWPDVWHGLLRSDVSDQSELLVDGHRAGRHDDLALDVLLSASRDRRKRRARPRLRALAHRRRVRLLRHRLHVVFHDPLHRGDDLRLQRIASAHDADCDQSGLGRCDRAQTARRRICGGSFCTRHSERRHLHGLDSAAFDRLLHLRSRRL